MEHMTDGAVTSRPIARCLAAYCDPPRLAHSLLGFSLSRTDGTVCDVVLVWTQSVLVPRPGYAGLQCFLRFNGVGGGLHQHLTVVLAIGLVAAAAAAAAAAAPAAVGLDTT